jgi:phytoene/squalene synthetase
MVIDSLIKTTQKRMAVNHYENFPVASVLLPASIRTDVVNLYRFARSADDIADEGDSLPSERLRSLTQYRQALHTIGENQARPHLCSPCCHDHQAQLTAHPLFRSFVGI